MKMLQLVSIVLLISLRTVCALPLQDHNNEYTPTLHVQRFTPELVATATEFPQVVADPLRQQLDEALAKLANVYMQALFSGTHTTELALELQALELTLFDLLDTLYTENRMAEYMKYEAEVTHNMIIYNLLKKLFGYAKEEE